MQALLQHAVRALGVRATTCATSARQQAQGGGAQGVQGAQGLRPAWRGPVGQVVLQRAAAVECRALQLQPSGTEGQTLLLLGVLVLAVAVEHLLLAPCLRLPGCHLAAEEQLGLVLLAAVAVWGLEVQQPEGCAAAAGTAHGEPLPGQLQIRWRCHSR